LFFNCFMPVQSIRKQFHDILTNSLTCILNQHAWALIRHYEPVLANPPGGGLVPRRWDCTMPRVVVWALETPPGPRTWTTVCHLLPNYYQVPIDVTAGWAVSSVDARPPFNRWVNWSSVSKVSCSRKQQHTRTYFSENNFSKPVVWPFEACT